MQRIAVKLVMGIAITAIGMLGADSSIGTWKFNAAKSKSTSTNPLKSRTDIYEATSDGGIKLTRTEQRADGTKNNISYSCKYDGKPCPVTGGPYDSISVKRVDPSTTTFEVTKTGGKYHITGKRVISKDGKTMIWNSNGTDGAGKAVESTYVLDKQ